jgi:Type II secretion system (T2SS), protein E, N-terminal domain
VLRRLIPTGQALLQSGLIDERQLQSALSDQEDRGGSIGEALTRLGLLTEKALLAEMACRCGVPFIEIGERAADPTFAEILPESLVRARRIVPIAFTGARGQGILVVATSEPRRLSDVDEIADLTGMTVRAVLASTFDVDRAIARCFAGARRSKKDAPTRAA